MKGTSFSVTRAMVLMPPRITMAVKAMSTMPTTTGLRPKLLSMAAAIELA